MANINQNFVCYNCQKVTTLFIESNEFVCEHCQTKNVILSEQPQENKFPSWLIYVGILLLINLCSYLFDWPFWIY